MNKIDCTPTLPSLLCEDLLQPPATAAPPPMASVIARLRKGVRGRFMAFLRPADSGDGSVSACAVPIRKSQDLRGFHVCDSSRGGGVAIGDGGRFPRGLRARANPRI